MSKIISLQMKPLELKKHIRKQHYLPLNAFDVPLNPPIFFNLTTITHVPHAWSPLRAEPKEETNACTSPCTIGMFKSRYNAYNLISLLPHPPLPFQISSIEWFTHGKLAKLPYISEIIQNLLASQLLHSHFVSGSEIPKVKVKTRGQKIQKQHNEMIDERSNIEWILWTRKRPKGQKQ